MENEILNELLSKTDLLLSRVEHLAEQRQRNHEDLVRIVQQFLDQQRDEWATRLMELLRDVPAGGEDAADWWKRGDAE